LVVPPMSTYHCIDLLAHALGDIKVGHGKDGDGMCTCLNENLFPNFS
jgi:hypothetical protein